MDKINHQLSTATGHLSTALLFMVIYFSVPALSACPANCAECPCFDRASYTFTIDENTPIGTSIASVTATPRYGPTLSYSTESSFFNIDPRTGDLTVGSTLDFESEESHMFRVIVIDDDYGYSTSEEVTVNVINRNDNPPHCSHSLNYISLPENTTSSFQLPNCTDADGQELAYQISDEFSSLLSIDSDGLVTLSQPLDFEEKRLYDIYITVNDTDIPPDSLSTTIRVIVTVEPVNEFSPAFTQTSLVFNLSESTQLGSVIGRVSASDEDSGKDGELTYFITAPQTNMFIINTQTGDIILTNTLDYEETSSHTFTVIVTDSSLSTRSSATTSVTINVLDSNDNSPTFPQPVYFMEVMENTAIDTMLTQLSCIDLDSGTNKELVYSIQSGNDRGIFAIDDSSGNVSLVASIDYDSSPGSDFFRLTIQCEEVASPNRASDTLLLIGVISFNSFAPQPTEIEFSASLSEDTPPGSSITRIQATDRDRGIDGKLRYYINYASVLPTCPEDVISIDESSGVVYLISPLDYETGINNIYCLVTIQDSGHLMRSKEVDLVITVTNVNDEPPRCFPTISTVYVAENHAIGDYVFSVLCNDTDSTSLQYLVVSEQPHASPFQIEADENVALQSSLDYEVDPFYLLSVQVSDGLFITNTTIRVIVGNVNEYLPVFTQPVYNCSVFENAPISESIPCDIIAVDEDGGKEGEVRYRLLTVTDLFLLSPEGQLVLAVPGLGYASQSEYLLEIEAYDLGSEPLASRVFVNLRVLDMNNNEPSMTPILSESIAENSPTGSAITTVHCTDTDDGPNGEVELLILHISQLADRNYINVAVSQLFSIDSAIGEVTLLSDLDFETSQLYKLTVLCRDHGTQSLSSHSTLFIEVLPLNEYSPVLAIPTNPVQVPERTRIGESLFTIQATDEDNGADGMVEFSLLSASGPTPFEVNSRSGEVVLSGPLDCDLAVQYALTVVAEDQGQPKLSSNTSITVNITTCHLGGVVPGRHAYSMSVVENAPVGEGLGTVSCSSTRTNILTHIEPMYRTVSGATDIFTVNAVSGEITVQASPDYETQTSHSVRIECYDPNHQYISETFSVLISILPVNEFAPEFFDTNINRANISEDTMPGVLVLQLQVRDRDGGQDGEVRFSISNQDSSAFVIDEHTGEVYLAASLDRETADELTFTATAQDSSAIATQRRSAAITVAVSVTDVNDNWPRCGQVVHHLVISATTKPPHVLVSNFACTDADKNENSELMYQLSDDSFPENLFQISSSSLLLAGNLNSSGPFEYYLSVTVRDEGSPSLVTNLLVIVEVQESDVGVDSDDYVTFVKEEGLKNAAKIQLTGVTVESWESTKANETFQEAVAKSVTHFCALLPEACSIVSGCREFYGTRDKRSVPDNYAEFSQMSVIISPNLIATDNSLEVQFYVTLPSEVSKSPHRETNYVVPGPTLDLIVEKDGRTIEAVVRDNLAQRTPALGLPTWVIVVLSVVGGSVASTLVALLCGIAVIKRLKKNKTKPIVSIELVRVNPSNRGSLSSSSSGASSNKAVCDKTTLKKWTLSEVAAVLSRNKNSDLTTKLASKTESNSRQSVSSSDISTRAMCDDYRQCLRENHSMPEECEDDDISLILLGDETPQKSGGTSMENIPSQCGGTMGRRILDNYLKKINSGHLSSRNCT